MIISPSFIRGKALKTSLSLSSSSLSSTPLPPLPPSSVCRSLTSSFCTPIRTFSTTTTSPSLPPSFSSTLFPSYPFYLSLCSSHSSFSFSSSSSSVLLQQQQHSRRSLSVKAQLLFTPPPRPDPDVLELARRLQSGERRAVAKAITLVESTLPQHKRKAASLLAHLTSHPIKIAPSFRVGITGPPGVGKSTFIEALGMHLISQNLKVAVLAIDPSSARTGGSILGDKTRMYELSINEKAFVRPSPTGGALGGVTRHSTDAIMIFESSGYDVIIVETVGVGQSETMVDDMVDLFMVLLPPVGGDELQGLKKGVIELADLIVFNKADGEMVAAAKRAQNEYSGALTYLTPKCPHWRPKVTHCSAIKRERIQDVWNLCEEFKKTMHHSGAFEEKRVEQRKVWMWRMVNDNFLERFQSEPGRVALLNQLEQMVSRGILPASWASETILDQMFTSHPLPAPLPLSPQPSSSEKKEKLKEV